MVHLEELDDSSPPDLTFRVRQDENTQEESDQNSLDSSELADAFLQDASLRWSIGSFSSLSSRGSTNPTTIRSNSSSRAVSPSPRSLEHGPPNPFERALNRSTNDPSILEAPKKPICWNHGCNGREFSNFGDLLMHQREKSGASQKSECHTCGAEFTRQTAKDRHIQHDMCKPRKFETPLLRLSRPASACQRCRSDKVKCDGKLPACTACVRVAKAATCGSTSDQLVRSRERDYMTSLVDRIEGLQKHSSELRTRKAMGIPELPTPTNFPGINMGTELQPTYTLTACIICKDRKTRCDTALPRCGHCERTDKLCEYFDEATGTRVPRMHILTLQNQIKELEGVLEQFRSGKSPPYVVPKIPLGGYHSPAPDVAGDSTLDEIITKIPLNPSDAALRAKAIRWSRRGKTPTFPHRPSSSTDSLGGNAQKVYNRTDQRFLPNYNGYSYVAPKTTLHTSNQISPRKLVELIKNRAPEDLLLLDLRARKQYLMSRIHNAVNLSIPVTLPNRPMLDVQVLSNYLFKQNEKAKFEKWRQTKFIIAYDAASELPSEIAISVSETLNNFKNEGYQGETLSLDGDYHTFASMFPEMIDGRPADASIDSRPTIEPSPDAKASEKLDLRNKSFSKRAGEEKLASRSVVKPSTTVDRLSARVVKLDKNIARGLEKGVDSYEMGRSSQKLENHLGEELTEIGCAGKSTNESAPAEVATSLEFEATHGEPSPSNGVGEIGPIVHMHTTATWSKTQHQASRFVSALPWGTICKHGLMQAILIAISLRPYSNEGKYANFMYRAGMNYGIFFALYSGIPILMRRRYGVNLNRILNGQEYTVVNAAKCYVEKLTAERWDWWPLTPSFRPLQLDEVRTEWECESGHTHWSEFSKEQLRPKCDILGQYLMGTTSVGQSTAAIPGHRDSSSSSDNSRSSGSLSSDGRSSPATSDTSISRPPNDDADPGDNGASEHKVFPPGDDVAVNIVPPSKMNGYIIFGVQGSKRLQGSQTRLAQIDVNACNDDDSFFDEMKAQYKLLRGYLRWIFSIWVFHTCEFIMFYKANPNEIMPGPEELPPVNDMDYRFAADRYPPILSSVFNASFYGCNKACIKARLDVMSIFHECKGRNHCGKYRILDRLPKRQRKWSIDSDEEKDEAWGLHATFGVSFYKVALYHLLILAGPITFWGLWLQRWPADWQNASIPFFAVVVLLSLFWLPFTHKAGSKEKGKRKMA